MEVSLWVKRTRGRHNEGGKKREKGGKVEGRRKVKRKEENKGERKRRCRRETEVSSTNIFSNPIHLSLPIPKYFIWHINF